MSEEAQPDSQAVLTEKRDRILVITINRPEAKNAASAAGRSDSGGPEFGVRHPEAIALAERITANGPLAVAATKRIIVESRGWSPEEQCREQMKIIMPVFGSKDAREGAVAFAEKRPPNWTGS